MGESNWHATNEGRMRARVEARRRREQQLEALRDELEENVRPVQGAILQARERVRSQPGLPLPESIRPRMSMRAPALPNLGPKFYGILAAALLMACLGLIFVSRGWGQPHAAVAAPQPTSTPDTTMAEVKLLSQITPPEKPVTILLLGSDQRPDDPAFRTDVVMLMTVDSASSQVSAVSFPRDLITRIPGYGEDRINLVMQYGGFGLMQDTLEQNFGARPDYYFMTNFDGFVGLINSIGGIDVQIAEPLEDACDLNWSRAGVCEVEPGQRSMDGATALWYIRSRHTSSDFDRLRRAQEVMVGIFARFMNMHAILRLPELYGQYRQDVETNMDVQKILSLMPTAAQVLRNPSRVHRYAITANEATDYTTAAGAQVLLPNYEAIQQIIKEASFQP